jgi:hypothetical protein
VQQGLRGHIVLSVCKALLLFSVGAIAPVCAIASSDSSCSSSCGSFQQLLNVGGKAAELCRLQGVCAVC